MTSDEKIAQLAAAVDEETKARPGAPQTHPEFDRLVRTIWRLRQEDGCPWDKEQTHQSISKNMIEEAYEAVEAIAEGSPEHLEEELGDVLEQVVLHSQIEADSGASAGSRVRDRAAGFDIDDVCRALNQKLVRRHPHVFGPEAGSTSSAAAVLDVWESVKAEERASAEDTVHTEGLLDSVHSLYLRSCRPRRSQSAPQRWALSGRQLVMCGTRLPRSARSLTLKPQVRSRKRTSLVTSCLR